MPSVWFVVIVIVCTIAAGLGVGTTVFMAQGGRNDTSFNIIGALFFGAMAMLCTGVGTTALLVMVTA